MHNKKLKRGKEFLIYFIMVELRSAFANLSMTLYIDHEPLNEIQVPKMCRIIERPSKKDDILKIKRKNSFKNKELKNWSKDDR